MVQSRRSLVDCIVVGSRLKGGLPLLMTLLIFCLLLGCLNGLRSLTPPAVVCWAAYLGWLHLAGTKLAFMGRPVTLILFTLLAAAELIAD
jgi:uncharacterized membrane protein